MVGDKGNLAIPLITKAIEDSKVTAHLRFTYCNLNEESLNLLAVALEKNKSLSGFSCLYDPCTVVKCSADCLMHEDKMNPLMKRMEEAVIKTKAPLQIWNNRDLDTKIQTQRKRHNAEYDSDEELRIATKMMKKRKAIEESSLKLKQQKTELIKLIEFEKTITSNLVTMKNNATITEEGLQQLQIQVFDAEVEVQSLQVEITQMEQGLKSIDDEINDVTEAIDFLKTQYSCQCSQRTRASSVLSANGSKTLEEELNFVTAKALSLEEANRKLQEVIDSTTLCDICSERPKIIAIMCGHRICKPCFDRWKRQKRSCPFCKKPVKGSILLYN